MFMKNYIMLILVCLVAFVSCLPIICRKSAFLISNLSNDTIIIGYSACNSIDSVTWFVNSNLPIPEVTFNGESYLNLGPASMIMPDSIGISPSSMNDENILYFFVIKWETAKKYTWEEICREELYDTLFIVTREMVKDGNGIGYCGVGRPIKTTNKVWQ